MTITVSRSREKNVGNTYYCTPAAMVWRVEAGIAILKSPAVREQVVWVALSIMWYVGPVQNDESLLIIGRPDHDMIKDQNFNDVENKVTKR